MDAEQRTKSKNVFADLGVPNPEEALAKAELAATISSIIKKDKLTQRQAAERMGIDQAKVSALVHGRLKGFSIERLLRFIIALGKRVDIIVSPQRKNQPLVTVRTT